MIQKFSTTEQWHSSTSQTVQKQRNVDKTSFKLENRHVHLIQIICSVKYHYYEKITQFIIFLLKG